MTFSSVKIGLILAAGFANSCFNYFKIQYKVLDKTYYYMVIFCANFLHVDYEKIRFYMQAKFSVT